jgi:hypothetical protein
MMIKIPNLIGARLVTAHTAITIAATILIGLASAGTAKADLVCVDPPPEPGKTALPPVQTFRRTYLPISGMMFTNLVDTRTNPDDAAHEVRLRGSLHYRRADGDTLKNRPVLIFNHGHEKDRGEACAIVRWFTAQGWVVFAPLRRGYRLKPDDEVIIRSTGIHIDDYVTACMRTPFEAAFSDTPHLYCSSTDYCRPNVPCSNPFKKNAVETDYLNQQRTDVRDQIDYLKSLPAVIGDGTLNRNVKLADAKRIVILGHSYGGSLITMTNVHDYGQSVAVSVSGGELSWGGDEPYWEFDLVNAMDDQARPMYFLQPKNGRTLAPMKRLFPIAIDNGYRSQASVFPTVPCTINHPEYPCNDSKEAESKQAHGLFIGRDDQVALWGPSVIEFAKRYPR